MRYDIQSLQFSWFVLPDNRLEQELETAFVSVVGQSPANFTRLRPPQSPVPVSAAQGALDDAQVVLQHSPGRIDLAFSPPPPTDESPPAIVFGNQNIVADKMAMAYSFCDWIKASIRQSIIVKAACKINSLDDAGLFFSRLLKSSSDFAGSNELVFQINRVKEVDAALRLNRVLKWQIETVMLQTWIAGQEAQGPAAVDSSFQIAYLNDINTVPDRKVRGADEQRAVLRALEETLKQTLSIEWVGELLR